MATWDLIAEKTLDLSPKQQEGEGEAYLGERVPAFSTS